MKTWIVCVMVREYMEVSADTREEAEAQALDDFDPTAHDYEIYESFLAEGEDDEDE